MRPGLTSSGRVDWKSADTIEAMTRAALGQSIKRITRNTALGEGQIHYRMGRAGIRLRDYREGRALGGEIADDMLKRYHNLVQGRLPNDLPTKKETMRH